MIQKMYALLKNCTGKAMRPVWNMLIDDRAKDGSKEFFTNCALIRISIESFKIRDSNAMHLGYKLPRRHL